MQLATAPSATRNGHASNGAAVRKSPARETATIPTLDVREFALQVIGTTPLIVHNFDAKCLTQIEDKQQKKAKSAKIARDPNAEFLGCFYMMPGSPDPLKKGARYGIPAAGFRKAAISACRYLDGINMTFAKGAMFVLDDGGGLIELQASEPFVRRDNVRIGPNKVLDLRYRPEFTTWSCRLRIRYNASVISAEQIINMFHHAGFHVGWGEWRPEKGGSYGMFEVRTAVAEKKPKRTKRQ